MGRSEGTFLQKAGLYLLGTDFVQLVHSAHDISGFFTETQHGVETVQDLAIARGLDYYTGTVYETSLLDHPEIGSICSGGRYDNLAGYYIDKPLPGVGISIGLTRLFYVLGEQGYLNEEMNTAPCDVLVLPMTEDLLPAIRTATALRERGIRTQLYSEAKKFKAKMAYADRLGIPFAVILGEDEIAQGKCSLKDLRSGEQVLLSPEEAAEKILPAIRFEGSVIRDRD